MGLTPLWPCDMDSVIMEGALVLITANNEGHI